MSSYYLKKANLWVKKKISDKKKNENIVCPVQINRYRKIKDALSDLIAKPSVCPAQVERIREISSNIEKSACYLTSKPCSSQVRRCRMVWDKFVEPNRKTYVPKTFCQKQGARCQKTNVKVPCGRIYFRIPVKNICL